MCSPHRNRATWPSDIVESWKRHVTSGDFVAKKTFYSSEGNSVDIPDWISPELRKALCERGIETIFSHQSAAWQYLMNGQNIVLSTPTASGKTLSYNVPVLETLRRDPRATALYLFPTKALARDQEESVRAASRATGLETAITVYDGDTRQGERRLARAQARILISNPDMLHLGILPHHAQWARFFGGLHFVVIDELHTYRGVFGSHVANVIRRLLRVAAFYGAKPVFAACSATIANPRQLAEAIVERNVELISDSGAPQGARTFAFYNPRLIDEEKGIRHSYLQETARLAADLIRASHPTLVFARSRRAVEIVLRYVRDSLGKDGFSQNRVRGYRGGYLPTIRREIESALKSREIDAVVATSALELGIDVGSLDAVVMAGYPGTVAGFHQRAGRAGRRLGPSLAVLVASADPLDQFLIQHPEYLLRSSPEKALVHPDNVEVLVDHLQCAAFELPFRQGDRFGRLEASETRLALDFLEEAGEINASEGRFFYVGESFPAEKISLRNAGGERIVVVNREALRPIAEMDGRLARRELYPQAVYLSDGQTYLVETLDLENGKAVVSEMEPLYYTIPMAGAKVVIENQLQEKSIPGGNLSFGEVVVTEEISGFKKVRFHTHENLGYGQVDLPPVALDTEALWLTPLERLFNLLGDCREADLLFGLMSMGYAFHQIASLHLMCDPRDLAFVAEGPASLARVELDAPMALFFYDTHPGGVGLAARAFEDIGELLRDTRRLIEGCSCSFGCPSCIGPSEGGMKNGKDNALKFAKGFLGLAVVE